MAANRFATMVHRKTNKLTLILIYAVLEWTLIVLLLLNSLFSYLIIKFARYFGLKPPCMWCSRVDHIFEPGESKNMNRDLLCEVHAIEISKLGFCSNHKKLAQSQGMCEDCSSSRPGSDGIQARSFALFPWMKEVKMIENGTEKVVENGEMSSICSCCGVSIESSLYSPYIVIKPSWDVLECAQKRNLITETGEEDKHTDNLEQIWSDSLADQGENEKGLEEKIQSQELSDVNEGFTIEEKDGTVSLSFSRVENLGENGNVDEDLVLKSDEEAIVEENQKVEMKDESVQVYIPEDLSPEILPQHLEFFIDCSGHRLVPVELIDSTTEEDQSKHEAKDEDEEYNENQEASLIFEVNEEEQFPDSKTKESGKDTEICELVIEKEPKFAVLDCMEIEEDENCLVFHAKECGLEEEAYEQFDAVAAADEEERNSDVATGNENEADVSIGTEIPDLDVADEVHIEEPHCPDVRASDVPSTSSADFNAADAHGSEQGQEPALDLNITTSLELTDHVMNQQSFCLDLNEIEEEKVPDTPTSIDSLNSLHKKLLLLDKKDSGAEESLDGSVISELEGDGVLTVERLKAALRAERKALHALYAELEEERSASAVAANQTMAMINRLQEEKAAMQMEALQYQRMMEEQSEYDQEALQLLNEHMVKREKEKQELEKELEVYRKKLMEYDTKEKMKILSRSKDGSSRSAFSSASCSNAEDSDGLSIDLNQDVKEEDSFYSQMESINQHTPTDAVLNLEESLADFEEERMAILEQLKALEEKLLTMDYEEAQHFEDVRGMEDFLGENGEHMENGHVISEVNGHADGFLKGVNGKTFQEKRIDLGPKGKSLLPLFDAISDENGDILLNGIENGSHSSGVHDQSYPPNKLAIEEELVHVHERLQALEADREFLKQCIGSLKKGDKGMHLLQEILQHLRDLRNVDIRVRSLNDPLLV